MALFLSALAFAASADRLVLKDGTIITTRGSFQVKGRVVIFTQPNGTLSSLRVDEVDLDASRPLAERQMPPPEPVVAEQSPEDDLAHGDSPPLPQVLAMVPKPKNAPAPPRISIPPPSPGIVTEAGQPHLLVQSWEQILDGGLEIRGTLANNSSTTATRIVVRVVVLGPGERILAQKNATLAHTSLAPQQQVAFSVALPQVLANVTAVHFEVESHRLEFVVSAEDDGP